MTNLLFYLIILFLLMDYFIERVLDYLNEINRKSPLPEEVRGLYDEEKYHKSAAYDKAREKISTLSSTLSLGIILVVLFVNGFALLDSWVRTITQNQILMSILFFGVLALVADIIGLPFSIYSTFVVEEKFGFNRTTPGIFVFDKIKGLILSTFIGGGLLALVVWFYEVMGENFWLYAWGIVALVTLFFTMFYTSLIVPLFNKLTPLGEGDLRKAIEQYAKQVSFPLKNIFIIDGSKRSTKANAYFSGIGSRKSIVLFDTLIKDHSIEELVAILAHEVGHYKKKHIMQGLIISILQMGLLFYLVSLFINSKTLAASLGAKQPSFHIGLMAFSLLYSPISMMTGLLMNLLSRKNEFEADNFARKTFKGEALQTALKKLSVNQLTNLNPHPSYVFFHYSHPPLVQRLKALQENDKGEGG